jgi:hypothetical protein
VPRGPEQVVEELAVRALRVAKTGSVAPADRAALSLAEPFPRPYERLDLGRVAPRELIDGPRGDARLPQRLDLVCRLALSGFPELAGKRVTLPRELLERKPVEIGRFPDGARGA